jgi:hypothetical protein
VAEQLERVSPELFAEVLYEQPAASGNHSAPQSTTPLQFSHAFAPQPHGTTDTAAEAARAASAPAFAARAAIEGWVPAGQPKHVVAPSAVENRPTAHGAHRLAPDRFAYSPAAHFSHAALPGEGAAAPGVQLVQASGVVAPAAAWNEPAWHGRHALGNSMPVPVWYVPAPHSLQDELPKVPAAHATGAVSLPPESGSSAAVALPGGATRRALPAVSGPA